MELKWNVYYHSINKNEITTLNIFNHWKFNEDVQKNLKKIKDKDEFAEKLRRDLMYYFWSKSEYEIIISPWCGGRDTKDIKVDIYTQVMNNWDIFLDYVWNSKKRRKNKKETKFTFVTAECGDWQALYINEKLAAEGHSVNTRDALDAMADILPNKVERYEIADEIAEMGMPTNLNDISNDLLDY